MTPAQQAEDNWKTTDISGEELDNYNRSRDQLTDFAVGELSESGLCLGLNADFIDVMQSIIDFEKLGGINKFTLNMSFHKIYREARPALKDIFDLHIEKIACCAAETELEQS